MVLTEISVTPNINVMMPPTQQLKVPTTGADKRTSWNYENEKRTSRNYESDKRASRTSRNYEADSDMTTDDELSVFEDDEMFNVIMPCENCGLDFWNSVCNFNDSNNDDNNDRQRQQQQQQLTNNKQTNKKTGRKINKVKRMKKRRDRDVIKRQLDERNKERLTRMLMTSQRNEESRDQTTCFSNRLTMKMTSLSLLERFVPKSDVIKRILRHGKKNNEYETESERNHLELKSNRKGVLCVENQANQFNQSNQLTWDSTGDKIGLTSDWRNQCLKALKKNNERTSKSHSKDIPTVQTCLFCFHDKNKRVGHKLSKNNKKMLKNKKLFK